jgi:hypothetical protein
MTKRPTIRLDRPGSSRARAENDDRPQKEKASNMGARPAAVNRRRRSADFFEAAADSHASRLKCVRLGSASLALPPSGLHASFQYKVARSLDGQLRRLNILWLELGVGGP